MIPQNSLFGRLLEGDLLFRSSTSISTGIVSQGAIVRRAEQPALLRPAGVVGSDNHITWSDDAFSREPRSLLDQLFQIPHERLSVFPPDETSTLDFGPNEFGEFHVIEFERLAVTSGESRVA